ncbi:hypothetical protein VPHD479_0249 [Vibrio phage D479]
MKDLYNFCKTAKLTAMDLLIWLDVIDPEMRPDECIYIDDFYGRPLRVVGHRCELIQIGESLDTFDRWANSVDQEFDVTRQREKKEFVDLLISLREATAIETNEEDTNESHA